MLKLSLAVIAHNSEQTLDLCLKSVQGLVSEIVFVDDHSTDRTVAIANAYQAKVITRKLRTCAEQKQFAIGQAQNEWVFLLDSDEACSEELRREIEKVVSENPSASAFKIPRRNYYFGKWLAHGGKYPDSQVRLYQKSRIKYSDHISHEKVIVQGVTGTLKGWIDHFAYPDLDTWWMKARRTAEFDALEWSRKGVRPSAFNFIRFCLLRTHWRFLNKYFIKRGFLDGVPGFLAAVHDVLTQILTYHFLSQKSES